MKSLAIKSIEKIKELKKVLPFISQFANLSDIQNFEYPNKLKISKIAKNKNFQIIKHL